MMKANILENAKYRLGNLHRSMASKLMAKAVGKQTECHLFLNGTHYALGIQGRDANAMKKLLLAIKLTAEKALEKEGAV